MLLADLRKMATDKGISGASSMRKSELISALGGSNPTAAPAQSSEAPAEQAPQAKENREERPARQDQENREERPARQDQDNREERPARQDQDNREESGQRRDNNQNNQNRDRGEGGNRNRRRRGRDRNRDRDRDRRCDDAEPEVADDEVLVPVAGILDVLDNYAFLRTSGYLPGPTDAYLSLGLVKKYALRKGDHVVGAIRPQRENEGNSRQKYNPLVRTNA